LEKLGYTICNSVSPCRVEIFKEAYPGHLEPDSTEHSFALKHLILNIKNLIGQPQALKQHMLNIVNRFDFQ